MSSTNRILDGNALYIGLFYRTSNAQNPGLFHWKLVAKTSDQPVGIMMHATSKAGWEYEVKEPYQFEESKIAVVALKIGTLHPSISARSLAETLEQIPIGHSMYETPPVWTCRIWVRDAVRFLHQSRIIDCPDVDALEAEAFQAGAVYRDGIASGRGSWGSVVSSRSR
ncbi:hypothetical protein DFH11DRAFT_6102 [Phellopilus nigrolimitatus]|nr:hypothetical protein DFH11DRAFT_6102 [Phellopilus nigrolimitatus]